MPRARPTRVRGAVLVVSVLLGAAACLSSCGGGGRRGGDPGNRLLHRISNDPALRQLPPGAQQVAVIKSPATYQSGLFQSTGWEYPGVEIRFVSTQSVAEILRYYARQAEANGWQPVDVSGRYKLTVTWKKDFPDAQAGLSVFPVDPNATASPQEFTAKGSIGPRTAAQVTMYHHG